MKKVLLCTSYLLFVVATSQAQDSLASFAMKKIFIEPIALVDFINSPSVRIGAEMPVSYATSAIATVGCYQDGYYLKGGIKRYGKTRNRHDRFLSVGAFYKK